MAKLAIVIPVLNDAESLSKLMLQLQPWRTECEVIVVDGGSQDASASIAAQDADKWLVTDKGRARQMQAGADIASAERLWFLHADSIISNGLIRAVLSLPDHRQWGYAAIALDDQRLAFRIIGGAMTMRSRWTGIGTGDQGIFVSSDLFRRVGGFAQIPLMEDVELSARLKRVASPEVIGEKIITSARRWQQKGVLRTILLMWWLRFQFFAGVSPRRLYRRYYPSA